MVEMVGVQLEGIRCLRTEVGPQARGGLSPLRSQCSRNRDLQTVGSGGLGGRGMLLLLLLLRLSRFSRVRLCATP